MNKIEESVQAFNEGYCCSQAILSIYGESLNLNQELALKMSIPFCGGMGIKSVCGALTGALMVIGIKEGVPLKGSENRVNVKSLVIKYIEKFKEEYGTIICEELLKIEDGSTLCPKIVRSSAKILESLIY